MTITTTTLKRLVSIRALRSVCNDIFIVEEKGFHQTIVCQQVGLQQSTIYCYKSYNSFECAQVCGYESSISMCMFVPTSSLSFTFPQNSRKFRSVCLLPQFWPSTVDHKQSILVKKSSLLNISNPPAIISLHFGKVGNHHSIYQPTINNQHMKSSSCYRYHSTTAIMAVTTDSNNDNSFHSNYNKQQQQ